MRALVTISVYVIYAAAIAAGLAVFRRRSSGFLAALSPRVWAAIAAGLGLGMFVIAEPLRDLFQDFLEAYYAGGVAVLSGATNADQLYSRGVNGFVNVPLAGVVFVPLAFLPGKLAAAVYLLLGVLATVASWRLLVRIAGLGSVAAALFGFCMLVNGPLMNSLKEGNTSHFALWAVAATMLYLRDGKDARAGALLAGVSVFKLPVLLFFVWAVLRGRWRFALSGGAVLAGVAAASIVGFGWDVHVAWYHQFIASTRGQLVVAFNNQSFPALFGRFAQPSGALCNWDPILLHPTSRLLSNLARAALLVGAVLALVWPRLKAKPSPLTTSAQVELEIAMVALLACLFSPLAWSHYYCLALPGLALLLPSEEGLEPRAISFTRRLSTLLLSLPVVWPWCSAAGPLRLPYLLFVSHHLIGATLLFGLLALRRAVGARTRVRTPVTLG